MVEPRAIDPAIAAMVDRVRAEMAPDSAPDDGPSYTAIARSANRKIGPIPAISRPQWSCPTDCALMGSGCYGETKPGRPSIFEMVDKSIAAAARRGSRLTMAQLASRRWRKVPPGLRFGVVGDYLTRYQTPDHAYIAESNALATSQPWVAWGYTHAWRRLNPKWFKYIVRASCESAEDAAEAIAAGWRAVIVDPGPDAPDTLIRSTIAGQRVVQCPVTAHRADGTPRARSCADCLLCGRDVPVIVAFPTHGAKRGRAAAAVRRNRAAAR